MTDAILVLAGPLAAFALLSVLPPLRRSGKPAAALSICASSVPPEFCVYVPATLTVWPRATVKLPLLTTGQ